MLTGLRPSFGPLEQTWAKRNDIYYVNESFLSIKLKVQRCRGHGERPKIIIYFKRYEAKLKGRALRS